MRVSDLPVSRAVKIRRYERKNKTRHHRVFYVKCLRCNCAERCLPRKALRKQAQRAARENLIPYLLGKFKLDAVWAPPLAEVFRYLEGVPAKHLAHRKHFNDLFCYIALSIDRAFDEEMRWERCEREPTVEDVTGIFDHTIIPLKTTDPAYLSKAKNKFGVKFLCTVTCQGTFIFARGPWPASQHDFSCCKEDSVESGNPVHELRDGDFFQCDLGYVGCNPELVSLPFKKPPDSTSKQFGRIERNLTEEQQRFNSYHSVSRARVEHSFSNLKRRFSLFALPMARDNVNKFHNLHRIGLLFKLACLAQAHHMHAGNTAVPKYATCVNKYWQHVAGKRLPGTLTFSRPGGRRPELRSFPNKEY